MAVQMLSPKKFALYFAAVLILSAIFLSTCSEKSEYGEASDYEKLGASCVNSTGDTSAPTISELSPSDNSTNVPVASKVIVTFSDAMLAYSVTTNTADTKCSGSLQLSSDNFSTCIKMSGSPVASDNDTIFTVTPVSNLSLETNYKVKITTSAAEASCNKLATDNTTTNGFTTAAQGSGTIKGKVKNFLNNDPLSGVNVQFYGTTIDNSSTDSGGDFNTEVDVGDYTITYSKSGFVDESVGVPLETDGQTLQVRLMKMTPDNCTSGTTSGNITDAVTGDNVTGVYLEAKKGQDMPWRRVKATDTTNSSGEFSFNLTKFGKYTVYTSKSGYVDSKFYVTSCGNLGNQDGAISENLPGPKSMRIVLSWPDNQTGKDLDSHIYVPDNSSAMRHLFFDVPLKLISYSSTDNVTLDRDEVLSPGKETITIIEVKSGKTYSYSVHDYTNRDNTTGHPSNTAGQCCEKLGNSEATVTVYLGSSLPQPVDPPMIYSVPGGGYGNLWKVFTFTESGGLSKVESMHYEDRSTDVFP